MDTTCSVGARQALPVPIPTRKPKSAVRAEILDGIISVSISNAAQALSVIEKPKGKRQPPQSPAVRAEQAKLRRQTDLRAALEAMLALYSCEVEPRVDEEDAWTCAILYTYAKVELAYLDGQLDTLDLQRVSEEIATRFSVHLISTAAAVASAFNQLEDAHAECSEAADAALKAGKLAVIGHRPLFDMADASRAFKKTKERDKYLFGRKLIRPSRIDPKTGGWAKTKRTYTGMPTIRLETGDVVRAVPDGPGTDRFTTAERKAIAAELDVYIDTVRRAEREKTEEEFDKWASKLRKAAATKAKNEAEKAARGNKRRRKPGKKTAVLGYIEAVAAMGGRRYSERHAFRLLKGLSVAQIEARTPRQELVCIYGTDLDVSDKTPSHPAFPVAVETDDARDGDAVADINVSDSVSDKDASHPAFRCSFTPNHTTDSTVTKPSQAALAQVMAHAPQTAEEAARIDIEEGPDSNAWWAVQILKAQALKSEAMAA
jgi:hypothetical protein